MGSTVWLFDEAVEPCICLGVPMVFGCAFEKGSREVEVLARGSGSGHRAVRAGQHRHSWRKGQWAHVPEREGGGGTAGEPGSRLCSSLRHCVFLKFCMENKTMCSRERP